MSTQVRRWTLIAIALLWVIAVARGARELVKYESTPGPKADSGPLWPVESRLQRNPNQPTLVLLA